MSTFCLVHPECQPVKQEKKSTRSKKKKKYNESLERKDCGELSRKKKELLRVAKKYRVNELVSRCVSGGVPRVTIAFVLRLSL